MLLKLQETVCELKVDRMDLDNFRHSGIFLDTQGVSKNFHNPMTGPILI